MALPQGERQSHREDLEFRPCPPRRAPHHNRRQRPGSRCTMSPTPAARTPPSWGRGITSLLVNPGVSQQVEAASAHRLVSGCLSLRQHSVMRRSLCCRGLVSPVLFGRIEWHLSGRPGSPSRCLPPVPRGGRLGTGDAACQEA